MSRIPSLLAALTAVALPSPLAPGTGHCSAPVLCPPWLGPILERAVEPIDGLMLPADLLELANCSLTLPTGTVGDPDDVHPHHLDSFNGTGSSSTRPATGSSSARMRPG